VWEAVKGIQKCPTDGRAAISKALLRSATFLKDVATELAELGHDEDRSGKENGEENGENVDGSGPRVRDEDDMRFDDEDFDEEEMRVATQCAAFATASFGFMRALVAPIVRGAASDVHALEKVLTSRPHTLNPEP